MPLTPASPMQKLLDTLPQKGSVYWIGIRTARRKPVTPLTEAEAVEQKGLKGDHFSGGHGSKRQVTLIMQEHIDAIASVMKLEDLSPELLRRNIMVKGINLLALKDKTFRIGEAVLEYTGECHPCSRMEENLGQGGYNAVRGHGGITARILKGGKVKLGDEVIVNV